MPESQLTILIAVGSAVLLIAVIWMFLTRYRKVGPNEALIVSGARGEKGRGFRIVRGGGTFVFPFIESAQTISLEVMTLHIHTPEVYTVRGVPVQVDGIAQI